MLDYINIKAPILPGESMAGLELYTHIKEYYSLLEKIKVWDKMAMKYVHVSLQTPYHIIYTIKDTLDMVFHALNGKLMKITARKNYSKKKLQGITFR